MHDTPERTAAAFALGVAVGFSPFIGFHTLIGIALAFVFHLNRVSVIAGIWVNLPWFLGPYYAAATFAGAWFTGTRVPTHFLTELDDVWDLPTWRERIEGLVHLLQPLLAPFVIGSMIGSIVLGLIAYRVALAFVIARRRRLTEQDQPAGR
jgi:uncharacterized protein (DUF2062 family)